MGATPYEFGLVLSTIMAVSMAWFSLEIVRQAAPMATRYCSKMVFSPFVMAKDAALGEA